MQDSRASSTTTPTPKPPPTNNKKITNKKPPHPCAEESFEGTSSPHMMSTKNSQGLPMAFWKDWRLPVSSGGTALSSRTGGPPGGPLLLPSTLEPSLGRLYKGGTPGGPYEWWLWWLLSLWLRWLSWLWGLSLRAAAAASDSLPLPPDLRSFSLPAPLLLVSLVLLLEPLLLLPVSPKKLKKIKKGERGGG